MQNSMETTQKTSRKRKHSSLLSTSLVNSPFYGVLTRQKSQKFFFSRNRSGKSRICRSFQQSSAEIPTKVSPQVDVNGDDDDECQISIKDLRARRVFSTPPKKEIPGKVEKTGFDSELVDCTVDYIDGVWEKQSVLIKGKCDSGVNFKREGFNGGSPNFVMLKKSDLGVNVGDSNLCVLGKCVDSGPEANLIADDLIALNHDSSMSSKEFDGYEVNLMVEDLDGENPNFLVAPEKCESMINCGNPNLTVLKKCDSRVCDGNPSVSVLEKCDDSRVNLVAESLNGGTSNFLEIRDSKLDCSEKFMDDMNPNLSDNFIKGGVDENCEVMNEETVQTTPPEAVLSFRKSDEENVWLSGSSVSRSLNKQISPSKDGCAEVKNSSSIKEMTLNKCSRRKVFKVPNSFTYKRLLPYLMDMAKDEPCTLKDNPSVTINMDVEEKPFGSLSQESIIDDPKSPEKPLATMAASVLLTSIDRHDELSFDSKASSPSSQQAAVPTPVECSFDKSQTNLVSSESQTPDVSNQDVSEVEHISPDNLATTFHSPTNSQEESKKDERFEPGADDMELEREESLICKFHSSNSLVTGVSSGAPVGGLTKGILKRNPRGCRGICSCLNCASFRLNAEKAFEFSRNQLLEAEEVAQDLMEELSNLSCMLKKSVTGATEVGIVPHNQVEEACRRASNVEEMAKARLCQMHEDFYVHSRTKALQRPRVNFSRNVQESVTVELTNQNDSVGVGMNPNLS